MSAVAVITKKKKSAAAALYWHHLFSFEYFNEILHFIKKLKFLCLYLLVICQLFIETWFLYRFNLTPDDLSHPTRSVPNCKAGHVVPGINFLDAEYLSHGGRITVVKSSP